MENPFGSWVRRIRLNAWFPHIPIALAVGLLGILQILPALPGDHAPSWWDEEFHLIRTYLAETAIQGLPQGALGIIFLLLSFGLAFRSRLSWMLAIVTTTVMILIETVPKGPIPHPLLVAYNGVMLGALLLAVRRFNNSSIAAATLFAITMLLVLLLYSIFGSYILGTQFNPNIRSFEMALYFAVVTLATVGYGDIVPQTEEARLFVVSFIVVGIVIFTTGISTILLPLINRRISKLLGTKGAPMKKTNHYVIVGDSSLARNCYLQLKERGMETALILPRPPEERSTFHQAEYILGDGSDLDVLREGCADKAAAIMALGEDDSENAFVTMAAKELGGKAKTVTAVNDSRNLTRIKRVHPDVIIAPGVLGGELLAMTLNGESMDTESLLAKLWTIERPIPHATRSSPLDAPK